MFGGTNQADDLTSQITASFLRGWGIVGASEHPSLEDFNAAMYAMSQFIAYQHQMGVPEWHAEQEYHIGSICTHNGESYQSLQNANIGSQPPSAKWTPVLTSKNGLANLGLGDGSALPVGVPVPWPLPNPPQGWLKYNGAPFDKIMFPKLGAIYPSGILPDLRGEFIRGWDDGRGADSGRTLLSLQYASTIGRFVSGTGTTGAVGVTVFGSEGASPGDANWAGVATGLPTKIVQQLGDGVRPRNIAFNYIVRAA